MMSFYATKDASNQLEELEQELVPPHDAKIQENIDEFEPFFSYSSTSSPSSSSSPVVVVQDRESETESSSSEENTIFARSKRVKKSTAFESKDDSFAIKRSKFGETKEDPLTADQTESLSSISDATTDEDVAHCLMMMSRDKWENKKQQQTRNQELGKKSKKIRGRYKCGTCNKLFRSYQALGGHRASHKKTAKAAAVAVKGRRENSGGGSKEAAGAGAGERVHECPFCHRVFASGQALGGHKRTHFLGAKSVGNIVESFSRNGGNLDIDLNLPAKNEENDDDDDENGISQIEISAVSDADFSQSH